ncbi:MAG: hypothetical protein ACLP0J_27480 [Solirubrobacteraceae bacterium]
MRRLLPVRHDVKPLSVTELNVHDRHWMLTQVKQVNCPLEAMR